MKDSPRQRKTTSALALALACLSPAAAGSVASPAGSEDLQALSRQLEHWVGQRHPWQGQGYSVSISAGAIDARTRLAACRQPVVFELPPGQRYGSRASIMARCPDQPGWRLLWPVAIQARTEVLVARQALPAGSTLDERHVMRQLRDVASLPQGAVRPDQAEGLQTRMAVTAGSVIAQAQVRPVPLVRRGQQVMLRVEGNGISIGMAGEALADAGIGETVRVRNLSSGRQLEGMVSASGDVEVRP